MTDEELATLHEQWQTYAGPLEPAITQVRALLAEVERMREIVRAVAQFDEDAYPDGAYCCHWCGAMYDGIGDRPTTHTPECPVLKARAILGQ